MNKTLPYIIGTLVVFGLVALYANMRFAETTADPAPGEAVATNGKPIIAVAIPAALSPDAEIGKQLFDAKCASCHGSNAAGQEGTAPPLVHKIYEPNHHSDMAFMLAAKNGVRAHHWPFGNMPPVEGVTDADVKLIARYIRELQKENGIF